MVGERPEVFPRVDDVDTPPGVWLTPPHPRRDAAWDIIPRDPEKFRQHVLHGRGDIAAEDTTERATARALHPREESEKSTRTELPGFYLPWQ